MIPDGVTFYCKFLGKVMNDAACRVCRSNGDVLRKRYGHGTDFKTRDKCQDRHATIEIPEEHSMFAPVVGDMLH